MSDVRRGFRILLVLLFVFVPILAVLAGGAFWFLLDKPYGNPEETVVFTVPSGSTIYSIAPALADAGLVEHSRYIVLRFRVLDKMGKVEDIKAGRLQLTAGARPSELISALTSPTNDQRVFKQILLSPGLTSSEIAGKIDAAGLADAGDVMDAILKLADRYPILPNDFGLQGYLYPETYQLEIPMGNDKEASMRNAEIIISKMADSFFEVLDEIDPSWKNLTRVQLHEKVTLASIVEREYRVSEEASLIAAVFNNRLEEGMKLQSCATLVYAIQETEDGERFLDEYLRNNRRILIRYTEGVDSSFNTYLEEGLPPGPISIPGYDAIEAVFFPADSNALYFVVKDPVEGTHVFTREYSDHLEARESYLNQYQVKD